MVRMPAPKECMRCHGVYPPTTDFWDKLDAVGEPTSKTCKACNTPKARTAFQLEELKKQHAREMVTQLVAAARANQIDCPDFTALTTSLVAEFGGVEPFCVELVGQIRDMKAGSVGRVQAMLAIGKMVEKVSDSALKDVEKMNDEELDEEVVRCVRNLRPHLLTLATEDVEPAATG